MTYSEGLRGPDRARPISWPAILSGAIVGIVVSTGFGPMGFLLPLGTECQLGPAVGTYTVWSPGLVVNVPTGGAVGWNVSYTGLQVHTSWDANYTMTSGSLTVGALPEGGGLASAGNELTTGSPDSGGLFVGYKDINWTFYETENLTAHGISGSPCSQRYVAESWFPADTGCDRIALVPLANNSSDFVEPHVWNGTVGVLGGGGSCGPVTPDTYVWFDSSLHSEGAGAARTVAWDLCGQTGNRTLRLLGTAQVPVTIWAPLDGHNISASGLLSWYSWLPLGDAPTARYTVPAGWNWTLGAVGPTAGPINPLSPLPGLVAFERNPC